MKASHSAPWLVMLAAFPFTLGAQPGSYSFENAQQFLKQYCQGCHQGSSPAGGFDIQRISTAASIQSEAERWNKLAMRVKNGEMPPKVAPAPPVDQREQFTEWATASVRAVACSAGVLPGPSHIRRLNREEYAATIRDLLDIQMDLSKTLPADGAGGEGFDNAAETLFLSPLLSEKYLQTAKFAMDAAGKDFKPRERILVAKPGNGVSPEQAARAAHRHRGSGQAARAGGGAPTYPSHAAPRPGAGLRQTRHRPMAAHTA